MPIQAFVASISFPKTIEQLIGMFDRNIEGRKKPELLCDLDLIEHGFVEWSLPYETRPGDFVFWQMTEEALERARRLLVELEEMSDDVVAGKGQASYPRKMLYWKIVALLERLDSCAGHIFALGTVLGKPEFDLDPYPSHFSKAFYAPVGGIKTLEQGIRIGTLEAEGIEKELYEGSTTKLKSANDLLKLMKLFMACDVSA